MYNVHHYVSISLTLNAAVTFDDPIFYIGAVIFRGLLIQVVVRLLTVTILSILDTMVEFELINILFQRKKCPTWIIDPAKEVMFLVYLTAAHFPNFGQSTPPQ